MPTILEKISFLHFIHGPPLIAHRQNFLSAESPVVMTAWREIGGCDPPDPVLTWALATTSLSEIFCMLLPFTQPGPATTRGGAYRANMHSPPHHLLLSSDARAILAACGMRKMQHCTCTGWWPNLYFGRRLFRQKICSLSDMAQDQATLL